MLNKNKIAILSTGNGGQTMAAYLSAKGYSIALYAREQERVDMFPQDHLFHLSGIINETVKVDCISCNMAEVLKGAHLVIVTTPAQYHTIIAQAAAPYLQDGQIVLLSPGRTFGTYTFAKDLVRSGCRARIRLAETETFLFTCRCAEVARPQLFCIKHAMPIAAHFKEHRDEVMEAVSNVFPGIEPTSSTLKTGFSNIGMVFHPLPILLNITRVEAKENFLFYHQGISPLVANILERLDRERVRIANAYEVDVPTAEEWLFARYGSLGSSLFERIQNTSAYAGILAPTDIDTRYVYEDILTGFVPMYYAAKAAGVDVPIIRSAILWASTIYHYDFLHFGRNDSKIHFKSIFTEQQSSSE